MRHLSLLIATFLLVACGGGQLQSDSTEQADSAALRVAVMPTLDCLPLFLAYDHGMFDRHDARVALLCYDAQMDQDTALQRGHADVVLTDLVRAERMQQQGLALNYLSATPLGWQLLTNRTARLKQMKQLDDKMVAMTRFSATDLLCDVIVDSARLAPERLFRIQVNDVAVRLNMLETGMLDAMWLPEPQATQARLLKSPVLFDTRDHGIQLGVMALKADADTLRRQQTTAFVEAYNMACDSINARGLKAYAGLIAKYCHVKAATIDSLPANYHYEHAAPPSAADVERARAWLNK